MFAKQVSPDTVIVETPAKVNLFLEVLHKLPDGYHEINSLFQAVSLFDRLTFSRVTDFPEVTIHLTKPAAVPLGEDNLISRAFQLLRDRFDLRDGLKVELEKNIPTAAGLAGGSSDAAATLLACTILYDLPLDFPRMADLSLEIGSDLPFFFSHGQALVTGRGENIRELELPTDYWLVLITPKMAISTADSYAGLRRDLTNHKDAFNFLSCLNTRKLVECIRLTGNDFEDIYLLSYPELGRIRDGLLNNGAMLVRMSGSGPTIFGIFFEVPEFDDGGLNGHDDWQVNVVRPIALPARLP